MSTKFSSGHNAVLGAAIISAYTGCVIDLYTGVQPVTADSAAGATLLGRITLNSAAFTEGTLTNGLVWASGGSNSLTMPSSTVWGCNAIADGTIGWFMCRANAADNGLATSTLKRFTGTVGVGTGELQLSIVNVTAGTPILVQQATYIFPNQ